MARYYAIVRESLSVARAPIFELSAETLAEARREASRDLLGGCLVREGRVVIYDADPRTTPEAVPVAVLKA